MTAPAEAPLLLADAAEWRAWLSAHHGESSGAWVVIAKKGFREPTSLTYDAALEEALCHGWIDSQMRRRDEPTYMVRFSPRRPGSRWTDTNVAAVERLAREGRMHPAGVAAFERRVPG